MRKQIFLSLVALSFVASKLSSMEEDFQPKKTTQLQLDINQIDLNCKKFIFDVHYKTFIQENQTESVIKMVWSIDRIAKLDANDNRSLLLKKAYNSLPEDKKEIVNEKIFGMYFDWLDDKESLDSLGGTKIPYDIIKRAYKIKCENYKKNEELNKNLKNLLFNKDSADKILEMAFSLNTLQYSTKIDEQAEKIEKEFEELVKGQEIMNAKIKENINKQTLLLKATDYVATRQMMLLEFLIDELQRNPEISSNL